MHNTDAQVSGPLTPPMRCLDAKHVMGWDEAPENMLPFFTVLLPFRINRVPQEDPNQLEGGILAELEVIFWTGVRNVRLQ